MLKSQIIGVDPFLLGIEIINIDQWTKQIVLPLLVGLYHKVYPVVGRGVLQRYRLRLILLFRSVSIPAFLLPFFLIMNANLLRKAFHKRKVFNTPCGVRFDIQNSPAWPHFTVNRLRRGLRAFDDVLA